MTIIDSITVSKKPVAKMYSVVIDASKEGLYTDILTSYRWKPSFMIRLSNQHSMDKNEKKNIYI